MSLTKQDYMNNYCTHREYYAQFVNDAVKLKVERCIGKTRLIETQDLSDIPLCAWDMIPANYRTQLESVGDSYSLAGAVCIHKEAARQIQEENH